MVCGCPANGQTEEIETTPTTPEPPEKTELHRHAVEINDDVVQALVVARMAVEVGDLDKAAAAIDRSLDAARKLVDDLLEADDAAPGSLVRKRPGR